MQRNLLAILLIVLLCGALADTAYCLNFMYFSEQEVTVFGDRIKWWSGDTLCGPVRSNDVIAIMQEPLFCDYIISSAADFWRGVPFLPVFDAIPPIFNAPVLDLPDNADPIREEAIAQGHFFYAGDNMQARVVFSDHNLRIWWAPSSLPFDSSVYTDHPLPDTASVFMDAPDVRISGIVFSVLKFAASGRIGLEDNVLYASSDTITGAVVPGHPEKLVLIAEGEIKVLNTPANGRENSAGQGNNQSDPSKTSIAINGLLFALNESFTFENQNDPDSGYVCTCTPDDRGTIYLTGGLVQKRRSYVHRSTRSSTGYMKQYRTDNDLKFWDIGFWDLRENVAEPAEVDLGEVAVGDSATEIIHLYNDYVPPRIDSVSITTPFAANYSRYAYLFDHAITVIFNPETIGDFTDTLRIHIPYYNQWLSVPISGTGIAPSASEQFSPKPTSFALAAYPNPFNSQTTLNFSLDAPGETKLEVFNLQGRLAAILVSTHMDKNQHRIMFNARDLAAGVYLARLTSGNQTVTQKLMLLK